MRKYCVNCGYYTATEFILCADCAFINDVPESFVPVTCGDELCYCLPNGEINLDGDCSHADELDAILDPNCRF